MSLPSIVPPASLDFTQPTGSQNISEGDDWIRYIQQVLKTYLVNIGGIVNASHTELNYSVGVTSLLQNQLDALVLSVTAALGNAPLWVSGSTYAVPAVVYSPLDFLNYRKITASSVTTIDPSLDTTNWTSLSPRRGSVLLAVQTASASATIDFASLIDSTYDEYEIHFQNVVPSANQQIMMRTSSNAGVSYDAGVTDYYYSMTGLDWAASAANSAANSSAIFLGPVQVSTTASHGGMSGIVRLMTPSNSTGFKQVRFESTTMATATTGNSASGGGVRAAVAAVNAIRFMAFSGNLASGSFKLYGLRKTV